MPRTSDASPATRGNRLRHCVTPVLGVSPHSLTFDRRCSHGCRVLAWPLKAVGSASRAAATAARQAVLGRPAPAAPECCSLTDVGKGGCFGYQLTCRACPPMQKQCRSTLCCRPQRGLSDRQQKVIEAEHAQAWKGRCRSHAAMCRLTCQVSPIRLHAKGAQAAYTAV